MSLLDSYKENCTMLDKVTTNDGIGGYNSTWVDGASFTAYISFSDSLQARIAEKEGVTSLYYVITPKSVNLQFHDVFRRNRDGKVFRVTSDGDDNTTPDMSNLNMRRVTAEEWKGIV